MGSLSATGKRQGLTTLPVARLRQLADRVQLEVADGRSKDEFVFTLADPTPRVYCDNRSLKAGPPYLSLHAERVVVDGALAFISSPNFTQRGQERNIEVGVLIADPNFASYLAEQWLGLIDARIVGEWTG